MESFVVFGVMLISFTVVDALAGHPRTGLWAGYLYFNVLTLWLIEGLVPAFVVVIAGSFLGATLRLTYTDGTERSRQSFVIAFLHRVLTLGMALMIVHLIYVGLGGVLPITYLTASQIIVLAIAEIAGVIVIQMVGLLTIAAADRPTVERKLFWSKGQRSRLFPEILLLIVAPVTALIAVVAGLFVFVVVVVVLCIQALRYRQFTNAQDKLFRMVEELAMLESVGRGIVSNLDMDDLLISVYQSISAVVPVYSFVVALNDGDRDRFNFPIVIVKGEKVGLDHDLHLKSRILHVIDRVQVTTSLFRHPVDREGAADELIGLPIRFGNNTLGVLCIQRSGVFTEDDVRVLQGVALQTGLALRNATLYNRSVKMASSLENIHKFVHDSILNIDIEDVLTTSCRVAIGLVDGQHGAVFLRESFAEDGGENSARIAVYGYKITEKFRSDALEWVGNLQRYADGKAWIVNSADDVQPDSLQSLVRSAGVVCLIEIPLIVQNSVVGLMAVYHTEPHYYTQTEIYLLEMLSFQLVAFIENVGLVKTLEGYAAQQAQLVHLSRISTQSLDLRSTVNAIARSLQQILNVKRVYIGVLDLKEEEIRFIFEDQKEALLISAEEIFTQDQEGGYTKNPGIQSAEQMTSGIQYLLGLCGDEYAVSAPLVANGKLQGAVVLVEPVTYTQSEGAMLEVATHQIASQIYNLREYENVQDELERRLEQLAFIEDLSREITRTLEIDKLIQYVLEAMLRSTQADLASLVLVSNTGYSITRRYHSDDGWHTVHSLESDVDPHVMTVIDGQIPLITDDPSLTVTISGEVLGFASTALVPLIQAGQVVGVLQVFSTQSNYFGDEHLVFLSNLAGHAVVSVQNARLLEERQRQIETLVRLRDTSLNISSDTSRYAVIREVLRAAIDIVPAEYVALYSFREDESIAQLYSLRRNNKPFSDPDILVPDEILRRVAIESDLVIVQNTEDNIAYQLYEHKNFIQYRGVIFAPIERGAKVQEIITLMFDEVQSDLMTFRNPLEMLLIQAAGHLENNELYEEIRDGHNRMSAILDASNDGILLLDRNGRLLQGNVSAERILGVAIDEFVGQNFAEALIHRMEGEGFGSEDARNGLEKMARTLYLEPERITQQQYTLRRSPNAIIHIDEVGSPVLNAQNEIVGRLLVLRDISEQKMLENYREEITHMVVHDLRGPLSSIISSLTLALEVVQDPMDTPFEEVLTPTMEVSLDSGQSLLRLVDSLLDIAKLENASMPLNLEVMPVDEIVHSAVVSLERLIQEANLKVDVHIPEDLPDAFADHDKIRRIMINLLDNAVRYSPKDGTILIEAFHKAGESLVTIKVSDSGRGIPPEEREHVFEKFHQVKNNMPSRGRKGTGLGLTFCKLTVEAHGGSIRVDSHPVLSGASFVFTLPVTK